MSKNDEPKKQTKVITIRIDEELGTHLDRMKKKVGNYKNKFDKTLSWAF
ncbi:MAG: hypothetical protein ACXABG_06055 [Promethearchaeota archaeon]|jgi:hypothetical protein